MAFIAVLILLMVLSVSAQAEPATTNLAAGDLIITGTFDGPLTNGTPKGVELYVVNDIPDLSIHGLGSANNGGGTDGEEFTFPAVSATAGEFIYVASESPNFTAFFGFAPNYTTGAMAINGDDAVELFANGSVSDVFGDINMDGSGEPWDHLDGWAYRNDDTGPDGSTFVLGNWSFSGINMLEGGSTNDTTNSPFPIGTYTQSSGVFINEIQVSTSSTDWEFFEIQGSPATDLSNLTLIGIDGDDVSPPGIIDTVIPLNGETIPADGFWLGISPAGATQYSVTGDLAIADNSFENGTSTYLLVDQFTGTAGDDLDTDDDGTLDVTPWTAIVDEVGLIDSGASDLIYSNVVVGPDGSFLPSGTFRCPDAPTGTFPGNIHSFSSADGSPGVSNANQCNIDTPPSVVSTDPADSAIDVAVDAPVTVTFDEAVTVTGTVEINCTSSGVQNVTPATGDNITFMLPHTDFTESEVCTVTILASQVADQDGAPDNMASDYNFSFTIVDAPSPSDVFINEVDADTPGTDALEFIELYDGGLGNTPLDGLTLVVFNGSDDQSYNLGGFSNAIDLDGFSTDGNGYFVIGNAAVAGVNLTFNDNSLQNGADAVALYLADGTDFPNDTAVTTTNLIDAIVYDTNDPDAPGLLPLLNASEPQVDENGNGNQAVDSNQRCPNGSGGNRNTSTYAQHAPTPGSKNVCPVLIHDVQGSGLSVTAPGTTVTVEGVVIGDHQGSDELSGFFLQEEDSDADGDVNTSEGIFVYCGGCAVDVAEGNIVEVTGKQEEFFEMSQLDVPDATGGSVVVVDGGDNSGLVTAVSIDLPAPASTSAEGTFEHVEGMLVEFVDELTVTEYFELARFGQIVLSEGGKLRQFTDADYPDATGYSDHQAEIATRRIILDDLNNDQNIDPVYHPQPGGFSVANFMRGGYTVTNLTGVMHWSFPGSGGSAWRIRPQITNPVSFTNSNPREVAPTLADGGGVAGDIKVASFNVLNYFTTIDTGSNICGPSGDLGCRGANSAAELSRQTDKIVAAMAIMNADIVGLMEIENNASPGAVDNLVTALNAQVGAGTYDYIDTGFIGSDAIKVAIIYKPAVVTPQGAYAVLDDVTFTDPNNTGTDKNRPALAQTFEVTAGANGSFGEAFTFVVNHLKSKGSGCGAGDDDTTTGQGNCNGTRTAASAALLAWLNTDPTDTATNLGAVDTDFLIGGDLNSYRLEDPITTLTNAGYTDVINSFEGPNAYSYVFSGEWGYLDHSLTSPSLTSQVVDVSVWHINSDEANLLDYNDTILDPGEASYEVKPATNPLYAADPYRASDHDPVIVGINLEAIDNSSLPNYGPAWHTYNGQWLGSVWQQDDGVVRTGSPWVPNASVGIDVDVTNGPGWLACWFDWDASLTFDNGELMVDQAVVDGNNSIGFTVPGNAQTGTGQMLNARCRLYPVEPQCLDAGAEVGCRTADPSQSAASPYGGASGGEVEDYVFEFTPTAVSLQTIGAAQSINMVWFLLLVAVFGLGLSLFVVRRRNGRRTQ